jgi:F-type H+-transporting ATPase subunit epsilon
MADFLRLKVVTPRGSRFDDDVLSFTARSDLGEFCLLPNHQPILAALTAGRMIAERKEGAKELFATSGGFLEAGPDHVNVMTENFADSKEIDKDALVGERASLEDRLAGLAEDAVERAQVQADLDWVRVRLEVKSQA